VVLLSKEGPPMRTRRFHPDDPAYARLTIAAVGLEFGLPDLTIGDVSKVSRQSIFARQVAMYLLQTVFDMTMTRAAELFARDRSTVAHALNVVEDSRDDPVFNRKLEKVETFLTQSLQIFRGAA